MIKDSYGSYEDGIKDFNSIKTITFQDTNFKLLQNQKESLKKILKAYWKNKNFILADERGFGKTVTIIAFLHRIF